MIAIIRETLAATFARKCSLGRSDMVVVATEPAARKITTHTVKRAKRVLATGGQPLVMTLVSAASTKKMPPEVVNRNTSRLKDPSVGGCVAAAGADCGRDAVADEADEATSPEGTSMAQVALEACDVRTAEVRRRAPEVRNRRGLRCGERRSARRRTERVYRKMK